MEKLDRRRHRLAVEQTEDILDKLDEIVDWINDRRELRCSECGFSTLESDLRENYGNCPNCGHKIN